MQCLLHAPPCVSTSAQYCVDVSVLGVHTLDVVARWCAHLSCSHLHHVTNLHCLSPILCQRSVYVRTLSVFLFFLSHLCWPSMTASTTPLNTCRGETLMSWYVHNSPHCAASTGAIACMHCCFIYFPLTVSCVLRWDNHVVPHCLHRAFVSPCSPT